MVLYFAFAVRPLNDRIIPKKILFINSNRNQKNAKTICATIAEMEQKMQEKQQLAHFKFELNCC